MELHVKVGLKTRRYIWSRWFDILAEQEEQGSVRVELTPAKRWESDFPYILPTVAQSSLSGLDGVEKRLGSREGDGIISTLQSISHRRKISRYSVAISIISWTNVLTRFIPCSTSSDLRSKYSSCPVSRVKESQFLSYSLRKEENPFWQIIFKKR